LTTREKTLLTVKIFENEENLAMDYNAREDLKELVPDIHEIFKTEGGFDRVMMELQLNKGVII
jgi:hypothetical protein